MNDQHVTHPWIIERKKHDPHLPKKEKMGFNGRLAVFITRRFGSIWMFYLLLTWVISWVVLATLEIGFFANDPYPFTFLLFLTNVVSLISFPILAVGQQILSKSAENQAKQTFRDAEAILELQDEVHKLIKINNRLTEEIHKAVVKKN
jgi:uncharacterized membrane protein